MTDWTEPDSVYVRIDGPAFDKLVRGEEAAIVGRFRAAISVLSEPAKPVAVYVVLADIGWGRMLKSIDDAMEAGDRHAS